MAATPSALAFGELTEVVAFLSEIDQLKSIRRRINVLGTQRHENTAEHNWHFAVAVMVLTPICRGQCRYHSRDANGVVRDIVEIADCAGLGLRPCRTRGVYAMEAKAAQRMLKLLLTSHCLQFHELWLEYEAGELTHSPVLP